MGWEHVRLRLRALLPVMRLALIGPIYPYRGGIAHHTANLCRALQAAGHPVTVLSFRRQYPPWLYPGRDEREPGPKSLEVSPVFLLEAFNPFSWLRTAEHLQRLAPHLVLIQWWTTFWGPAFGTLGRLLRLRGLPLAYLIHNVLPHERHCGDALLTRWALGTAQGFVAHSPREAGRLRSLFAEARVETYPLPPFEGVTPRSTNRQEARRRLNLPQGQFLLLLFGLVRPYKGVSTLLQALSLLREKGKRPSLAIVGEFWQSREQISRAVNRFGLAEQVRLEDRYLLDEEVGDWLLASDCCVLPYTGGTQSAVLGLARAFGLPLIASRHLLEGLPLWQQGAPLWPVEAGDPYGLAEAIEAAMTTPHLPSPTPRRADYPVTWGGLVETIERLASEMGVFGCESYSY